MGRHDTAGLFRTCRSGTSSLDFIRCQSSYLCNSVFFCLQAPTVLFFIHDTWKLDRYTIFTLYRLVASNVSVDVRPRHLQNSQVLTVLLLEAMPYKQTSFGTHSPTWKHSFGPHLTVSFARTLETATVESGAAPIALRANEEEICFLHFIPPLKINLYSDRTHQRERTRNLPSTGYLK